MMNESGNQLTRLTTPITLTPTPTKAETIFGRAVIVALILLGLYIVITNPQLEDRIFMSIITVMLVIGLFMKPGSILATPDGILDKRGLSDRLIPWEDVHEVRIRFANFFSERCIIKHGQHQNKFFFTIRYSINDYRDIDRLMEVIAYQADLQLVSRSLLGHPTYRRNPEE